jgi:hypothetical protein
VFGGNSLGAHFNKHIIHYCINSFSYISYAYGSWLAEQCLKHKILFIEARPQESVMQGNYIQEGKGIKYEKNKK